MLKVEIATNSVDKINGIKVAFARFFAIEETELEITHRAVDTGVSEQPFDGETYQGAKNRVDALVGGSEKHDYYVSCEAGIESYLGLYFNVQVVCIYEAKTNKYFFGKSAGWQIPSEEIEVVKKGTLDAYLRSKGITRIEELLGPEYSRANAVAQATELALASKKLNNWD